MLSSFFSHFGRPWLKNQRPLPGSENKPDGSEETSKGTDEQATDKEEVEEQEEQPSLAEMEGEDLSLDGENSEIPEVTAGQSEEGLPEQPSSSLGELMVQAGESSVIAEVEVSSTEQVDSSAEIEGAHKSFREVEVKNEGLLEDSTEKVDSPEVTVKESTPSMETTKEEAEPNLAKETVPGSDVTVEGLEPSIAENFAVENQVQGKVTEIQETSADILQTAEALSEIKPSKVEIENLEALEAKMETLVAAINTPKLETENLSADAESAELVNEVVEPTSITSKEESEEVAVVALTTEEKEIGVSPIEEAVSATEETVPDVEIVISPTKENLVTEAPTREEKVGTTEDAVVEADIKPVEALSVGTAPVEKDNTELDGVQPQMEDVPDDAKLSSTKNEDKTLEPVRQIVDKEAQVQVPVEGKSSPSENAGGQTDTFTIGTTEDLAEANEVLRKYGVQFRKKNDAEDVGPVSVKITRQENES